MTLEGFIALLPAILKFSDEIFMFVKMLQSTPQEDHSKLMEKVGNVFNEQRNNNRPADL